MPTLIDEVSIGGLKCDTPNCGFRDDNITRAMYPYMIDAKCPRCGNSMLTQKDYDAVLKVERSIYLVNKYFGWLGYIFKKKKPMSVDFDGTGKPKIT